MTVNDQWTDRWTDMAFRYAFILNTLWNLLLLLPSKDNFTRLFRLQSIVYMVQQYLFPVGCIKTLCGINARKTLHCGVFRNIGNVWH
jgi:hypothetical protein